MGQGHMDSLRKAADGYAELVVEGMMESGADRDFRKDVIQCCRVVQHVAREVPDLVDAEDFLHEIAKRGVGGSADFDCAPRAVFWRLSGMFDAFELIAKSEEQDVPRAEL